MQLSRRGAGLLVLIVSWIAGIALAEEPGEEPVVVPQAKMIEILEQNVHFDERGFGPMREAERVRKLEELGVARLAAAVLPARGVVRSEDALERLVHYKAFSIRYDDVELNRLDIQRIALNLHARMTVTTWLAELNEPERAEILQSVEQLHEAGREVAERVFGDQVEAEVIDAAFESSHEWVLERLEYPDPTDFDLRRPMTLEQIAEAVKRLQRDWQSYADTIMLGRFGGPSRDVMQVAIEQPLTAAARRHTTTEEWLEWDPWETIVPGTEELMERWEARRRQVRRRIEMDERSPRAPGGRLN